MGDLHECVLKGVIFYVAARDHFSEVVMVNIHSSSDVLALPKRDYQEHYSSVAVVLALLVLFGLEHGLSFIHGQRVKKSILVEEDVKTIEYDTAKEDDEVVDIAKCETNEPVVCLSPDVDQALLDLVEELCSGIVGHAPQRAEDGTSGVYFLKDARGRKRAVFKPADEEGIYLEEHDGGEIKSGCMPGDGFLKEVAASLLDKEGFHGVPRTVLARCAHDSFQANGVPEKKVGSLQEFIPAEGTSEDMGYSKFSTQDVHKIGLLDCRILNMDRHLGNMLVTEEDGEYRLVPIDHGLSMPSSISSGGSFEWLQFPQCKRPFDKETVNFVCNIDADRDVDMLRQKLPDLKEECIETMKICTLFLKKAVANGLNLFEIGCKMSRYLNEEEPCDLERVYICVKERMSATQNGDFWRVVDEEMEKAFL